MPFPEIPGANAMQHPDRIVLASKSKTVQGWNLIGDQYIALPYEPDPATLGAAARACLAAYRTGVPIPDFRSAEWTERRKLRFRASGVTSERAYMREARLVEISVFNGNIILHPTRNGGTAGPARGFHGMGDAENIQVADTTDDATFGRAILEAFERCTFLAPRVPRRRAQKA